MYKSTRHEPGVLGFLLKQEPLKTFKQVEELEAKGPESDEFGPLKSRTTRPGETMVPLCTADEARRRNGITDVTLRSYVHGNVLINKPHENCRWDRLDDWQEWHAALNGPTEAQLKIIHDWGLRSPQPPQPPQRMDDWAKRCEQLKEELYGHVPKQLAQQFDAIEKKRRLNEQGRQYRVNLLRTDKSLYQQKAEVMMREAWDKMSGNREAGHAHHMLVQGQTVNWAVWTSPPGVIGDAYSSIQHVRFRAEGRDVVATYDGFELAVGTL